MTKPVKARFALEPLLAKKAKENQRAGGQSAVVGRQISDKPLDTKRELGKIAKVSHDTIAPTRRNRLTLYEVLRNGSDEAVPELPVEP